jgi:hypothetical protein
MARLNTSGEMMVHEAKKKGRRRGNLMSAGRLAHISGSGV